MFSLRNRTLLTALLVCIIAIRASALDPVADSLVALAGDPLGAWRESLDGWSDSGTLGVATADGLRQLPFTGYYALTDALGLDWAPAQLILRALLMVLALVGAVKLAFGVDVVVRRQAGLTDGLPSWVPWIGALLYAGGPVMSAVTSAAPGDAMALAVLPWAVAPLAHTPTRWWSAVCGACWLGLAGLATPGVAAGVLAAGVLVAALLPGVLARHRVLWAVAAAAASAWWLAAYAWELRHAPTRPELSDSFLAEFVDLLGAPSMSAAWLPLVATAPLLTVLGALVIRAPVTPRALVVALLVASFLVLLVPDWTLPTRLVGLLTLQGLAGLLAWSPFWHCALRHPVLVERSLARVAGSGGAVPLTALVVATTSIAAMVLAFDRKQEPVTVDALWSEVGEWAKTEDPGRVLVLPASSSATEAAEVTRALGSRAWIGRDPEPGDSTLGTRAIDSAIDRLLLGRSGAGTVAGLQRLGVSHVLLRSDLSVARDVAQPLGPARSALAGSGATLVEVVATQDEPDGTEATGSTPSPEAGLVDYGVRSDAASVEIWQLPADTGLLAHPDAPLTVAGDPEATAELADAGVLAGGAVELTTPDAADVLTDTTRRRDVDLTEPARPVGPVVRAQDPITAVPTEAARMPASELVVHGVERVTASSSAAQVGSSSPEPGAGPLSAIDRNIFTSWTSAPGHGVGQWWRVEFEEDVDPAGAVLTFSPVPGMPAVTTVEVTTGSGSVELPVSETGQVTLDLPAQQTDSLRLKVTKVGDSQPENMQVALAEVALPDVEVTTTRTVPAGEAARVWLLSALRGAQAACVPAVGQLAEDGQSPTVCSRALPSNGEENGALSRSLDLASATMVSGHLTVAALPTTDALSLVQDLAEPSVVATSSSTAAGDLAVQAQAAADADPDTAWRAAPEDTAPTLSLSWEESTRVRGVRLTSATPSTNAVPEEVRVTTPDGMDQVAEVVDGEVLFDPVETKDLAIQFTRSASATTSRNTAGGVSALPLAVSEVELIGGPAVSFDAESRTDLGCGSGPEITLAGRTLQTSVTASASDLLTSAALPARLCGSVLLPEGESELTVEPTLDWVARQVLLAEPGAADADTQADAGTDTEVLLPAASLWAVEPVSEVPDDNTSGTTRTISAPIPAGSGWTLSAEKGQLDAVTLDGWAQGWTVSPDAQDLTLRYSPRSSLLGAAATGASLWLVVLVGALVAWLVGLVRSRLGAKRAD